MLLAISLLLTSAYAADFNSEVCADRSTISREMIELEMSGARWQGGDSDCLKQEKFKTVAAVKQNLGSPSLLDPEYLATGKVIILKEKWNDTLATMEVEFAYIGQSEQDRKPANVKDKLTYKVNFGRTQKDFGCASLLDQPKHFVMRKECHHD